MLGLDVCEYFITFLLRRWDALQAKMKEEKDWSYPSHETHSFLIE